MKITAQTVFSRVIDNVIAHPKIYVLTALVLTVLACLAIGFKFEIRSDLNALMPQDAQVVTDMNTISERMGSITTLTIYIKSPKLEPLSAEAKISQEYLDCLNMIGTGEHLLREKPPVGENWCDNPLMLYSRRFVKLVNELDSVGNVAFHNDKTFFENNILLYATNDELEAAYDKIDEALTEARRQSGEYKACLITADSEAECDELKLGIAKNVNDGESEGQNGSALEGFKSQLIEKYQASELANVREFPFYPTANGGWMVALNIRFKKATTGLNEVNAEVDKINQKIESIDLAQYDSNIEVEFGGGLNDMKAEYNAIIVDVVQSISITILSIFALMTIFFRSLRAPCRIFAPLIMSTLWSLGITFLVVGYLNLITAFIFAILLGLGIDFGIHLYSRYLLERRNGIDVEKALRISVVETGSPLFFGALTTTAAFYTLMFGSFPGFSQFGFVAGTGVLLAFMTMTTVMPAYVILMERIWPTKVAIHQGQELPSDDRLRKIAIPMVAVSILVIACAGFCVSRIPQIQFEDNFYNLSFKPKTDSNQKSQVSSKDYVDSKRSVSPTVVVLDNLDQVEALELLFKRNHEYDNFQYMRKVYARGLAGLMDWLGGTFQEVMPYAGKQRSIPMLNALNRTLPQLPATYYFANQLPLFATYGREKSEALRNYRNGVLRMPETMAWISATFPEVLTQNTVANAIPVVSSMTRMLPEWLWVAIPTQRDSQQLNTISDSASIFSYLPGTQNQQLERLATLQKIRDRTADRQIRFLPEDEKEKIRSFRSYLVASSLTIDDLPEWVKLQFKENGVKPLAPRPESGVDYAFGNIALLYQTTSTYVGSQASQLVRETRSIRIDDRPLTAATGAFVYIDVLKLVQTDGLHIAIIALVVILLLAMIQQRNPISALIITLPVLSGLAVTLAIMVFTDAKLGLFNIVMLPVTLGIGIDGAVYLYERYQLLGRGTVIKSTRAVLGPVFMSSSTTLVGFGGMVMSQHMGLNSMGQLAVIGISACFFTTFLIEPGLILIADKLKLPGVVPKD